MSALDLLLGTRRLRRKIEVHRQQLHRDIEHEQLARAQLRQTFVQRVTSPLGLLSVVGAGFVAGKMGGRSSNPKHSVTHAVDSATTLALETARSIGIQVVLPMAIEWFQSKFRHNENAEIVTNAQTEASIDPQN